MGIAGVVHSVQPIGDEQADQREIAVCQNMRNGRMGTVQIEKEPMLQPCLLDTVGDDDAIPGIEDSARFKVAARYELVEQGVRKRFQAVPPANVQGHFRHYPLEELYYSHGMSDAIRIQRSARARGQKRKRD